MSIDIIEYSDNLCIDWLKMSSAWNQKLNVWSKPIMNNRLVRRFLKSQSS